MRKNELYLSIRNEGCERKRKLRKRKRKQNKQKKKNRFVGVALWYDSL